MEEQLLDYDQALAEFNKAIELDPTYSDAYYGTGRLYYNKAVKQLEQADKIKDIKKSNDAKKQVDDLFKQSIPFFKKAIELKPTDIEVKKALRTVYYRLNMDAEWDAINKEIKAAN
jgi:tetratricopeptide (TPR) repeat protein